MRVEEELLKKICRVKCDVWSAGLSGVFTFGLPVGLGNRHRLSEPAFRIRVLGSETGSNFFFLSRYGSIPGFLKSGFGSAKKLDPSGSETLIRT